MKKFILLFCLGILTVSLLFLLHEVGRAGDSPQTSEPVVSNATTQFLKGSGVFLSGELKETGQFLLSIQDDLDTGKRYLIPKDLRIQRGEVEIRPSDLQKGDILDIDYFLSETGERVVTHLDIVIAAKEKEIRVEAAAHGQ